MNFIVLGRDQLLRKGFTSCLCALTRMCLDKSLLITEMQFLIQSDLHPCWLTTIVLWFEQIEQTLKLLETLSSSVVCWSQSSSLSCIKYKYQFVSNLFKNQYCAAQIDDAKVKGQATHDGRRPVNLTKLLCGFHVSLDLSKHKYTPTFIIDWTTEVQKIPSKKKKKTISIVSLFIFLKYCKISFFTLLISALHIFSPLIKPRLTLMLLGHTPA